MMNLFSKLDSIYFLKVDSLPETTMHCTIPMRIICLYICVDVTLKYFPPNFLAFCEGVSIGKFGQEIVRCVKKVVPHFSSSIYYVESNQQSCKIIFIGSNIYVQ